jgi:glycosyltransferase involved in cell wall biosynthesis
MKVAFVNQPWNSCPGPDPGSIAIWTHEVACRLADRYEVTVYAKSSPGQPLRERINRLCFQRYSNRYDQKLVRSIKKFCLSRALTPLFASLAFYPWYGLRVALDLRKRGCDVVHVHNLSQYLPLIKFLNPRTRIVLHMHCEWLTQLPLELVQPRIQYASLILGVSEYITGKIRSRFPGQMAICKTVFNGVQIQALDPSNSVESQIEKPLTILFVGRLTPEKGIHDLIDAFALVSEQFPDSVLRIIGPDSRTPIEYIVDLADNPKLSELKKFYTKSYTQILRERIPAHIRVNVKFLGRLPHEQLTQYYSQADVLVNPSLSESFGMALVEAMERGIPVIGTKVGGIPEIIVPGETGFLVEPGNVQALANMIIRMFADDRLRKKLGDAARTQAVQQFSWDRIAQNIIEAYECSAPDK